MSKERLKELYVLLSEYEVFLARRFVPPNFDTDEVAIVREVEEKLEHIIMGR